MCWEVLPTWRWWVENRGKQIAGVLLEEQSSEARYTTKAGLEDVWGPGVHHTQRFEVPRQTNHWGPTGKTVAEASAVVWWANHPFWIFFSHLTNCCCMLAHGNLQHSWCWMMLCVLISNPAKQLRIISTWLQTFFFFFAFYLEFLWETMMIHKAL